MSTLDILNTEEQLGQNADNRWFDVEYSEGGEVKNEVFGLTPSGAVLDVEGCPLNGQSATQSELNSFMSDHIGAQ